MFAAISNIRRFWFNVIVIPKDGAKTHDVISVDIPNDKDFNHFKEKLKNECSLLNNFKQDQIIFHKIKESITTKEIVDKINEGNLNYEEVEDPLNILSNVHLKKGEVHFAINLDKNRDEL